MKVSKRAMLQYYNSQVIEHMMYYSKDELVILDYIFDNFDGTNNTDEKNVTIKIDSVYLIDKLQTSLEKLEYVVEALIRKLMFRYIIIRDKFFTLQKVLPLYLQISFLNNMLVFVLDPLYCVLISDIKYKHPRRRWYYMLRFNSSVGASLYTLIQQYVEQRTVTLTLSEVKRKLYAENKYRSYINFKEKVLITGQKEINRVSDLFLTFDEVRTPNQELQIKFSINVKHYGSL